MTVSMVFLRPEWWPLLVVALIAGVVLWQLDRARARRLQRAVGPGAPRVATLHAPHRRARRLLFTAGLALATLAAMQPAWGKTTHRREPRGTDVVVCLDVSRSMLARDLKPSRLVRAQDEIATLCKTAGGNRLALVLFAGDTRLAAPLTRDLNTIATLARRASPLSVARGGSDLGAALAAAQRALGQARGEHSVIVVLTDGEDLTGEGHRAAEACRAQGQTVHCIGYGSVRGAKIPTTGTDGDAFLRDRSGAEVVSAMNPANLARIAETTGGAFVDAGKKDDALLHLYETRIRATARAAFEVRAGRGKKNRFQWPLLAALLCWMIELSLREQRRRGTAAVALLLMLAHCGRDVPDASALRAYERARAALQAGELRRAAQDAAEAARSSDQGNAVLATFLSGNIAFAQCLRAEKQADAPGAEPFAIDVAIRHAEHARDFWQDAAVTRADWPAARRNVERALVKLDQLEKKKAQRQPNKKRTDPKPKPRPRPAQPRNRTSKSTKKQAPAPLLKELAPDAVEELLARLAQKEKDKVALRRAERKKTNAPTERDW